jgi:hypothetical protein
LADGIEKTIKSLSQDVDIRTVNYQMKKRNTAVSMNLVITWSLDSVRNDRTQHVGKWMRSRYVTGGRIYFIGSLSSPDRFRYVTGGRIYFIGSLSSPDRFRYVTGGRIYFIGSLSSPDEGNTHE